MTTLTFDKSRLIRGDNHPPFPFFIIHTLSGYLIDLDFHCTIVSCTDTLKTHDNPWALVLLDKKKVPSSPTNDKKRTLKGLAGD